MNSAQFVKDPGRNLALELVRVTESAAMAAARKMGRGDKNAADQAAVNAMRYMFNTVDMDGVVVIGEDGTRRSTPVRPWVPITIWSMCASRANWTISAAGSPSRKTWLTGMSGLVGRICSNCSRM